MDGVTVDWATGMTVALGYDMSIYDPYMDHPEQINWELRNKLLGRDRMNATMSSDVRFWENLQPFPWTRELLDAVSGCYDIAFLTKPSDFPAAYTGKMRWCKRHYPGIDLVFCNNKEVVAARDKFLIDDDSRQVDNFQRFGGHAHLFKNQFVLHRMTHAQQSEYIQSIRAEIDRKHRYD